MVPAPATQEPMTKAKSVKWGRWVAAALSIAGVGMFGYSLAQLTTLQGQMNHTMQTINVSVAQTSGIVGQTAQVLQPLTATTQALEDIETREKATTSNLASMNHHLQLIGDEEQTIVHRLDFLNQSTDGIISTLGTLSDVNGQLLAKSRSSVVDARTEAERVSQLNSMTATTISELHQINSRLSALKILP